MTNAENTPIEERLRNTLHRVADTTVVANVADAPDEALIDAGTTHVAPITPLATSDRGALAWRLIGAAAVVLVLIAGAALFSRGNDATVQPAFTGTGTVPATAGPVTRPSTDEELDAAGVPIRPSARMQDHWHAAFGVYVCDSFSPPPTDISEDVDGIHTHGDGVIHIHPFTAAASGRNATLGRFADQAGIPPSADAGMPGSLCGGEPPKLVVYRWSVDDPSAPPEVFTDDLWNIRLDRDRMAYTIAFVPEGVVPPKPPSIPELDRLTDVAPNLPPSETCVEGVCTPTDPTILTIPGPDGGTTPITPLPAVTAPPLPVEYCPGYTAWKNWMIAAPGAQSTVTPEFRAYMDRLVELAPTDALKADIARLRDLWNDPNAQADDGSTEIAFRIDDASNVWCALRPY